MKRRHFLKALAAGVAMASLAPEMAPTFAGTEDVRSLWTPEQQRRLSIEAGFREGVIA